MNYSVSVIIPNFNRASFLKEALTSVLNQTYPVHEILVCDDGSTDDSKTITLSFKDNRIRWVECGRNGRPAVPRNIGIRQAVGEWLAFLDNDDVWLEDKLAKQIAVIKEQQVSAVCCNASVMRDGVMVGLYAAHSTDKLLDFENLVKSNAVICSSVIIEKKLLEAAGRFPESPRLKALEDYAAWLQVSVHKPFYLLSEPLLMYRDDSSHSIRQDSLSTEQQLRQLHNHFRAWYKANKKVCTRSRYHLLRDTFVTRFLSYRRGKLFNLFHP